MKYNLSKILKVLNIDKLKNDKRVVVFSVCLLIATSLWFLNALSKNYTTTLTYPVKYINPPKGKFLAKEPPAEIELKVNAHGFTLLRNKLDFSFSPIIINLSEITKNIVPGNNGYRISTTNLLHRISGQINNEININNVLPEVIYIKLDSLKSKTVPVIADIEYSFKPQFHQKDSVSINPDKVKITGPGIIIDSISVLHTEKKVFNNLDASLSKLLTILHPDKTTIKPASTILNIPVEKFTEKKLTIPIKILNCPEDKTIKLFPSKTELTLWVGLKEFETVNASLFELSVNYNDITPETENLKISIDKKPNDIKIIRISPENVEFIIETN